MNLEQLHPPSLFTAATVRELGNEANRRGVPASSLLPEREPLQAPLGREG
jgi:hypothetical protein